MLRISLEEAKPCLPDLIDAVLEGKTVFIVKDSQEAVQLVPAIPSKRHRFGSARGLIAMAENLDAPLPGFDEYMP